MLTPLSVEAFWEKVHAQEISLWDVRTPDEFALGHIPSANNLPLFDNEGRAIVGTMYKEQGHDAAVREGLELVGSKLAEYVHQVDKVAKGKAVGIYCWRGGMRSGSMAWLLDMAGYEVYQLTGGYKAFRQYVLSLFSQSYAFQVLSGNTGSGKTEVLHALAAQGAQVIDLEGLANHKGSAFGGLMQPPQPCQQDFEHMLFQVLRAYDPSKPIWVEDESKGVGRCFVPDDMWHQMQTSPVHVIDVPMHERVARLVADYADADDQGLKMAIEGIQKRLGGARTKAAFEALDHQDYGAVAEMMLHYYDAYYEKSLKRRNHLVTYRFDAQAQSPEAIAKALLVGES